MRYSNANPDISLPRRSKLATKVAHDEGGDRGVVKRHTRATDAVKARTAPMGGEGLLIWYEVRIYVRRSSARALTLGITSRASPALLSRARFLVPSSYLPSHDIFFIFGRHRRIAPGLSSAMWFPNLAIDPKALDTGTLSPTLDCRWIAVFRVSLEIQWEMHTLDQ